MEAPATLLLFQALLCAYAILFSSGYDTLAFLVIQRRECGRLHAYHRKRTSQHIKMIDSEKLPLIYSAATQFVIL